MKRGQIAVPKEVTSYFDGKTNAPAFSWLDVWAEEHAYEFTVAKAVELDVLNAFRSTMSAALASGQGYDSWKPMIAKELTRLGWWQPRMVADPEGDLPDRMVNFSSDRRLKTTFWANMNSARSAGQWERAQRAKKALPYALYVRTTSADPRPEHLLWVGLILPIDDPFWKSHWPPNGWGCKCQVRMITAREAKTLIGTKRVVGKRHDGTDIEIWYTDNPPDLGPDIEFRNRRTGEVSLVPPGIDPGWQTNPGLARAETLMQNLETRLALADHGDAQHVLDDLWTDPYLRLVEHRAQKTWLPAGHTPKLQDELKAVSPVVSIPSDVIRDRVDENSMTIDDFSLLPLMLSEAAVLPDLNGDDATRMLLWQAGKTIWRAFVKVSANGYLRVNSLHKRSGVELKRQLKQAGMEWPWEK